MLFLSFRPYFSLFSLILSASSPAFIHLFTFSFSLSLFADCIDTETSVCVCVSLSQDEQSSVAMLKKHQILEQAVEDYADTVHQLSSTSRGLVAAGHPDR